MDTTNPDEASERVIQSGKDAATAFLATKPTRQAISLALASARKDLTHGQPDGVLYARGMVEVLESAVVREVE